MHSIIPLIALLAPLATSTPITKSTPLPLLIWHGLGDNYLAEGLHSIGDLAIKTHPGTFVYYIHLAEDADGDNKATFFGNLTEQIAQVCADLAAHPILSTAPAVNGLGFSQGGQFLRGYVQRCNNPPVRNLVTFGSQHNGIAKYQICNDSDWLCKVKMGLLTGHTWTQYVQSKLVPAQYFRATDDETGEPTEEYLEYSNFLADINNERVLKNVTYAKNLASLNKLALYLFEDDTVVIPKESGWFAQTNLTSGHVTPLKDRMIYKEDWIGLKKLDEKGGLDFKSTKGEHMRLNEDVLIDVFETYFAPPSKGAKESKKESKGKASWEDKLQNAQELIEL